MLGAVLNPEKFLPIATGTLAIAVTAFIIYSKLKNIDKTLKELISSLVDDQLKVSMLETIQKQNSDLANVVQHIDEAPQMIFNKAINNYMSMNNQPKADRTLTDRIMEGDAGAIATLMNSNCGIDPSI